MTASFGTVRSTHRLLLRRHLRGSRWLIGLEFVVALPLSCGIVLAASTPFFGGDEFSLTTLGRDLLMILCMADVSLMSLSAKHRALLSPAEFIIYPVSLMRRCLIPLGLLGTDLRVMLYAVPMTLHLGLLLYMGEILLVPVVVGLYVSAYVGVTLVMQTVLLVQEWSGGRILILPLVLLASSAAVMVSAFLPDARAWFRRVPIAGSFQEGFLAACRGLPIDVALCTAEIAAWTCGIAVILFLGLVSRQNIHGCSHANRDRAF